MVTKPYLPLLEDPRRLLLDMAREHALSELLLLIVDRLAGSPRVALARIWLVQKSEDCGGCAMSPECPDRSACLHLAAGAGWSLVDAEVEWTRLDGAFRRFPLGERKVGRIAATGEPIEALGLRDRAGRFELADSGTLFLDEVGEVPPELQAKLLRVLQEGELERVGEERTRWGDVRLIAATDRDLRAEAGAGRFRQDLYDRLSVFPIALPPLRQRVEDIPAPAEHFLALAARKPGRPEPRLTPADSRRLRRYGWPGDVRELQHVIERAVILADGARLAIERPDSPATPDPCPRSPTGC